MYSGVGEYEQGEDGQFHRTSGRNSHAKGYYNEDSDEQSNSSDFQGFDSDEDDDFNVDEVKTSKKKTKPSKPKSTTTTKHAPRKNFDKSFIDDESIYEEKAPRKRKKVSNDYSSDYDDEVWSDYSESSEDAGLAYSREPRRTKSVTYFEEEEEEKSASESEDEEEKKQEEPKGPRIERIIGIPTKQTEPPTYFIKMANESYRHCKWLNEEEIMALGGKNLLNKYKKKVQQVGLKQMVECDSQDMLMLPEKEIYNIDFCEIDKIIAQNEEGKYLVLWKGLNYNDCTWEDEIQDNEAIADFERRNDISQYKEPRIALIQRPELFQLFGENYPLPPFPTRRELRDYQIDGINWLRRNWYNHRNCILADEMGLGKTVQGVNIIYDLYRIGDPGPFLVIAPLSTLDQWVREFKNWTPLNVVKFTGPGKEIIAKYELTYPNTDVPKFNVILTNPDVLIKFDEIFMNFCWHYVIVDEAHELRNDETKRYKFMESMNIQNLLLMTGTPIQNNLKELWSLLHLIDRAKFDSVESFMQLYDTEKDPQNATKRLQEDLKPYMLRRKKEDVEKSIGKKEETIVNVELTRAQKMLYRSLIEQKIPELAASDSSHRRALPELPNLAMQLRKVCCHPYLIQDYEKIIGDVLQGMSEFDQLVKCSGKMVFVDKLLGKLHPLGKKILIFSQFKHVLDIISQFLDMRNYKYERIDGGSHGNDRQKKMDRFNDPTQDIFVFLLSTRAGGLGLNLTAADTVIIFDSDWNPQNDVQAQARCHRIGQTAEKVVVYRLITRGTYESEMFDRASKKLGLDQAVLDHHANNESESKMDKEELENLIKRGAYYQLTDMNYEEGDNFTSQSIDEILDSRTRIFSSSSADSNSSFSTTNFTASEKDAKIDFQDPNFWKNLNPSGIVEPQTYNAEYLGKRNRSSIKRYKDDDGDDEDDVTDWSVNKVQKCLTALRTYGFNHWGPICSSTNLDKNTAIDGCSILMSKIFQSRDKELQKIAGPDFKLNDNQRRLASSNKTFNHKDIKAKLQQSDKIIHALQQLATIKLFIEGYTSISGCKDSNDWDSSRDKNLLNAVWSNGVGKWDVVLKDEKFFPAGFLTDENKKAAIKRYKKLIDYLDDDKTASSRSRNTEHSHVERAPPKPKVDPKLEKLFKFLQKMGMPNENKIPKIKEITGIEDIDGTIKRFFKAAIRVTEGKELKTEDKEFEPLLSKSAAEQLNSNRKWMKEFKHFFRHEFINHLEILKLVPTNQLNLPPFWNPEIHEYPLLKMIYFSGFYHLNGLTKKDPFSKLPQDDMNLLVHFLKSDIEVKKHVEYIIGVYKKNKSSSQPIILEKSDRELNLPITKGDTTIESLGTGKFFLSKGVLCREGFSAFVRLNNEKHHCQILPGKKFSVNGKVADNVLDAFKAANVQGGELEKFGVKKPFVMYWNQKNLQSEGHKIDGYERKTFKFE
ncbi:Type III restriction enzyme, res subunit family protein [Trichomonas vaginalis G3]|uniref:Type III restriction enzyme, res subunit family protein n=1 Tax=Trichomonas vaginalis (strain ATCC PRA-98 / G3) TaxID=412133 RepID=A2EPF9_TRIV3|nr:helicase protein [Trichomonas vaginalis G3]EAY05467.1 Type III restriction enzyme, res subunit family protein [Trichomonas vaginalis G3]KAI5503555.1 helicase protein [Trichomonas vaginalis G3]|eukprot:XP_001317690.1 Type III restriction enzyme, res subunit family protein [Trichomonas vaginalis G3]